MDAELEHRRRSTRPVPSATDQGDAVLVARIRDEIDRTGPITFARFMERALYEPELGYYRRPVNPAARAGDFLTAPETHPIFGATLAHAIEAAWRAVGGPADLTIREYGAGSGALARSIIDELAPRLPARVRYEAVEINDHRRDALPPPLVALTPEQAARERPQPAGVVLANEFLDAIPVHRVEGGVDGLREVFVDWEREALVDRLGPPSSSALAERLGEESISLEPGQGGEIALGLDGWFAEIAAAFEQSVTIVIDYGYQARDLYAPHRRRGTLLGYLGQTVVDDPYANVGRQDLTAHVDFTAVERSAARVGLTVVDRTTQASFLVANGIESLLERDRSLPDQRLGEYLELRSGLVRLIDPRAMGSFRVVTFRKGPDDARDECDGQAPTTAPQAGIG